MDGSLGVGRVLGVPVGVHRTWVVAFGLVAWSLAMGFFPDADPGWAPWAYWAAGAVAALLLFVSVLTHELSHAVVARGRGLAVRGITLFVFGGVAEIDGEAERPRDEFMIAAVGPVTSLALAALAWLASSLVPSDTGAGAIASYLVLANLVLALFNLVPGFPLDGGRVLRAVVWALTGSLRRATNVASYVGQAIALGLVAWGIWRILGGDLFGGVWTAFVGSFLNGAAEQVRRDLPVSDPLARADARRRLARRDLDGPPHAEHRPPPGASSRRLDEAA